eukprot:Gb_20735 [translate_table: standard]
MISWINMRESLEKLNLQIGKEEFLFTISKVDANNNGFIYFCEFVVLYESIYGIFLSSKESGDEFLGDNSNRFEEYEDMDEDFNFFYENGDGLIIVEEIESVVYLLGLKEGQTLIECINMI